MLYIFTYLIIKKYKYIINFTLIYLSLKYGTNIYFIHIYKEDTICIHLFIIYECINKNKY